MLEESKINGKSTLEKKPEKLEWSGSLNLKWQKLQLKQGGKPQLEREEQAD